MGSFLNLDLLRRPNNWLVVGSMVVIGCFAVHYALALIHGQVKPFKHNSRTA